MSSEMTKSNDQSLFFPDKTCIRCGATFPKGGRCLPCHAARQRLYVEQNPAKRKKTVTGYLERKRSPQARRRYKQIKRQGRKGKKVRNNLANRWIKEARNLFRRYLDCWQGNDQEGYKLPASSKDELLDIRECAAVMLRLIITKDGDKELRGNSVDDKV